MNLTIEKDIANALAVLKEGGIILYPTDTVWGIGCDATNEEAVDRIYSLKNRPDNKSMIVLLGDKKDIIKYVSNPDPSVYDYLDKVQKPTTVIYEGAVELAQNLVATDGSIAIRITHELFSRKLVKRLRKPLVSTSANVSGEPTPSFFREISPVIRVGVDYIVHHLQTDESPSTPSSVVRLDGRGGITVIRP